MSVFVFVPLQVQLLEISTSKTINVEYSGKSTECLKIYRKSVLHLLKHAANLYLSRCRTDLRLILGHSVSSFAGVAG